MMGEKDAGKTTLLAEIHDAYLRAPFAGFIFAGSKTLIGFEERCFLSRIKSGQTKEDTERTKYADIRLLHIALAEEAAPETRTHLLLTDVSGERFKEIRTSVEEARELSPLVRRADHVVLLVDGDRLTVAKTQMSTETNACLLLRCLLEAGGLSVSSSLDIVISKWDFVATRTASDSAVRLETAMRRVIPTLRPRFHHVAARSENPVTIPHGFGMDTLIQGWMVRPDRSAHVHAVESSAHESSRWYQRYQFRSRVS
jgi:hypothetical protein